MPVIHQVIAITDGAKKQSAKDVSKIHHDSQKADLFVGHAREYRPIDEATKAGEKLPADNKKVQRSIPSFVDAAKKAWRGWIDDVVSLDTANTHAKCKLFGIEVPATTTIFIQRRLEDWRTMIEKFPTLPPEKNWTWSSDHNCFVADEEQQRKTGKVPRAHVLYEATPEHPAQVEQYFEDVTVGWWHIKYLSGAVPEETKQQWLNNINAMLREVKLARGKANEQSVTPMKFADVMYNRIFGVAQPEKVAEPATDNCVAPPDGAN